MKKVSQKTLLMILLVLVETSYMVQAMAIEGMDDNDHLNHSISKRQGCLPDGHTCMGTCCGRCCRKELGGPYGPNNVYHFSYTCCDGPPTTLTPGCTLAGIVSSGGYPGAAGLSGYGCRNDDECNVCYDGSRPFDLTDNNRLRCCPDPGATYYRCRYNRPCPGDNCCGTCLGLDSPCLPPLTGSCCRGLECRRRFPAPGFGNNPICLPVSGK